MKYILIVLMLFVTLNADEMQRIESILNDIVELRSDFQECQAKLEDKELMEKIDSPDDMMANVNACIECEEKLQTYTKLYKDEKDKNSILTTKLNIFSGAKPDTKDKQIRKYRKLLKIKEYELTQLKNKINTKKKTDKKKVCTVVELESNANKFPKLMLKKQYEKHAQVTKRKTIKTDKEKIIKFKAATFRLSYESVIYDDIDGEKLFVWEKGKTFTSNVKTASWIKITGYFEKRKWKSSARDMWVKISQVRKR